MKSPPPAIGEYLIKQIDSLNQDTRLITFKGRFAFEPGQIIELKIPGYGEAPFAPTSDPNNKEEWQLCVRRTGTVTEAIHHLEKGDRVLIKGPLGHGWPMKELIGKKIVIVAGGLGIIPLRPLIFDLNNKNKHRSLTIFYGSRNREEVLFRKDFERWQENTPCSLTIDEKEPGWNGETGFVTDCLSKAAVNPVNAIALVCGPPVMFSKAVSILREKGFRQDQIYVSLERKMQCGIGKCQHCAIGPYYVCKDGPVFNYKLIGEVVG